MEKIYDMLIIGGGPAGYTAALYASRAGLDTVIIEKMAPGGQMTLTGDIDNYPGFDEGIDGFTLGMKMRASAERFGAVTVSDEVTAVRLSGEVKEADTYSGTYRARTVVIATGAYPRELGVDGERENMGMGIHYCAHCDGRFYKDRTVMVVGGGNSAAADALYLSRIVKKVILVHRRDELRAEKIYHTPLHSAENVEFMLSRTVSELLTDGKITGAKLSSTVGEEDICVHCDGIFVSIGRKPATSLFEGQLSLDRYGYIVADETTRTSIEGVYAVGDVRTKVLRQVVTAVGDGAVAVHFAQEYIDSH